jgi:hypothetical protein
MQTDDRIVDFEPPLSRTSTKGVVTAGGTTYWFGRKDNRRVNSYKLGDPLTIEDRRKSCTSERWRVLKNKNLANGYIP